jgi:protein-S-isoprenylcysteine O-methyltransferase Ste14
VNVVTSLVVGSSLWSPPAPLRLLGIAIAVAAVAWCMWSFASTRAGRGEAAQPPPFVLRGPYLVVRHPLCLGGVAILAGVFLALPSLLVAVLLVAATLLVLILVPQKERRSIARFGEAYGRYRAVVPALIPWRRRRIWCAPDDGGSPRLGEGGGADIPPRP